MHDHEKATGYRTVVVGCDGTPQADDAVALALQLLDRRQGRLVLANVFPFYRGWALTSATPGALASVLQERAEELLERVAATLPRDVELSLQTVSDSSVPRGLHDIAETEHADLIVLGSSHHGAVGRLANRTTVQRLLHDAPCAIAVAAPDRRSGTLRRIGVAFDGSREADAALAAAYALAHGLQATVHVSRASERVWLGADDLATAEEQVRRQEFADTLASEDVDAALAAAPADVPVEGGTVTGPPARAVLEDCADADLLVCGSHARGRLRRVLAGSTALGLVAHARVPVLVVPRPATAAVPPAGPSAA